MDGKLWKQLYNLGKVCLWECLWSDSGVTAYAACVWLPDMMVKSCLLAASLRRWEVADGAWQGEALTAVCANSAGRRALGL